ncbi:MAG: hypothetical protein NTW87_29295, partial [Planctomycetota bacterium]|nr:hypothetical protein [Planctomycetota bacterium]
MPSEAEMERRMKLGLTDAEWENPEEAMFSGGLVKMWNCRNAIAAKYKRRSRYDESAEEEQFENDKRQFGRTEAFKRLEQRAAARTHQESLAESYTPLWRNVSGMFQDSAYVYGPMERARCIMRLINAAARLIRYELKFHNERTAMKPQMNTDKHRCERTVQNERNGSGATAARGER